MRLPAGELPWSKQRAAHHNGRVSAALPSPHLGKSAPNLRGKELGQGRANPDAPRFTAAPQSGLTGWKLGQTHTDIPPAA